MHFLNSNEIEILFSIYIICCIDNIISIDNNHDLCLLTDRLHEETFSNEKG